jgi:hypothetical protein
MLSWNIRILTSQPRKQLPYANGFAIVTIHDLLSRSSNDNVVAEVLKHNDHRHEATRGKITPTGCQRGVHLDWSRVGA